MSARCPRCGDSYFVCGFCNSELLSIEAVLLEENSCKIHYCSEDCLDDEVLLLEERNSEKSFGLEFPSIVIVK